MKPRTFSKSLSKAKSQQGITLITTLLLLLLLVGMSLTMVLAVSSESLINGYYGRYRGSFYAADSGVAAARQQVMNQLMTQFPTNYTATAAPVTVANMSTVASQAQTTVLGNFGGTQYTPVNSANSWQERFLMKSLTVATAATTPAATCNVQGGVTIGGVKPTCANPTQTTSQPVTAYVYNFPYTMTIVGQSQGTEVATLTDSGTIIVNAPTTGPSYNQSFAAWGMFIGTQTPCSTGDLVSGTITGPVFTNGGWTFGNSGPYTFTDDVKQSGPNAGWDGSGGCTQSATPTNGINPSFNGPNKFLVNQPAVPLPSNSFNQEQAVLDGIGNSTTQPTPATMGGVLKNAAGNPYNSSSKGTLPSANGVYLPYSIDGSGNKTFNGGGIFVEGAVNSIVLAPGSNNSAQTYTISQGSPAVITTITIDPLAGSAGTTTISTSGGAGAGTQTINGVPQQFSAPSVSEGPATMLFVDGAINALSGPNQGQAAIQTGTALTVVASGSNNITITGDILYKTEPVTMTGGVGVIDQLIPANDTGQVLGIYTSAGNIQLNNKQTNQNLEIDASLAAISATGSGGLVNTGASIKTLTIVGGRIQNTIQNIGATTRNVLFDRRFLTGFAPPWFPSTSVTPGPGVGLTVTASWKGTQWLNETNSQ